MGQQSALSWQLTNRSGLSVRVGAIGAALIAIETPDRDGRLANIVLGLDNAEAYRANPDYAGVVVGRFANRIGGARFDLDGQSYALDANDGPNCLHGGRDGWHLRHWQAQETTLDDAPAICLSLSSPAGDGGFAGRVEVSVNYALTADNRLVIAYAARSNAATPFSPTQHSYWNLSGDSRTLIDDHALSVDAQSWLPVDTALIPIGAPAAVASTPLDFTAPQRIGDALRQHADFLSCTGGYDHCLILRGNGLRDVARLSHPPSGRTLTIRTDRPAMQLYTGQHLGPPYRPFAGVALETQAYPDAPNRPDFPDCILRPDAPFHSRTEFIFGTC